MSRAAVAALLSGVLAFAAVACSSTAPGSGATQTTAAATTPPTTAMPTARKAPMTPAEVEKLLIKELPAGFTQAPDSKGDTGPSDLAKATHDEGGTPEAKAGLEKDGFLAGYQRLWSGPGPNDVIVAIVYSFRNSEGARDHVLRGIATLQAHAGVRPLEVPDIPGAVGVTAEQKGVIDRTIAFSVGPFDAEIVVIGDDPGDVHVRQVALDQYHLLQAAIPA